MTPPLEQLAGQRFGRLRVIDRDLTKTGRPHWRCRCDCGRDAIIRASHLKGGQTSCGCLVAEILVSHSYKHGHARPGRETRTFSSWCSMRERCLNPNSPSWGHYGGRGIKIAPAWDDFRQFLADMGERPANHTLERRDHNGDYTPSNCCWATTKEQNRNKRDNRVLTFNGRSMPVSAWAEETGLPHSAILTRLKRLNWSVEKTLTTPKAYRSPRKTAGGQRP